MDPVRRIPNRIPVERTLAGALAQRGTCLACSMAGDQPHECSRTDDPCDCQCRRTGGNR